MTTRNLIEHPSMSVNR